MTETTPLKLDALSPAEQMANFKANTTGLYREVILQAGNHEQFAAVLLSSLAVQINSFVSLCYGHNQTVADITDTLGKIGLIGDTAQFSDGAVSIDGAVVRSIDPVARLTEIINRSVAFYFDRQQTNAENK